MLERFACMYVWVPLERLVAMDDKKGCRTACNRSFRRSQAIMWVNKCVLSDATQPTNNRPKELLHISLAQGASVLNGLAGAWEA